jgi:hypothetical protein
VPVAERLPTDTVLRFDLPAARHDAWVVFVVLGDDPATPAWPSLNPYTLAATNPVFVDRDGGGYASPRDAARAFLARPGIGDEQIRSRLEELDLGHAVHLLDVWARRLEQEGVGRAAVKARLAAIAGARATSNDLVAQLLGRL